MSPVAAFAYCDCLLASVACQFRRGRCLNRFPVVEQFDVDSLIGPRRLLHTYADELQQHLQVIHQLDGLDISLNPSTTDDEKMHSIQKYSSSSPQRPAKQVYFLIT
jgi:hypothetical protein